MNATGEYATFVEYCKERWDFARAHAYRLIESAKVIETVSPIGDKIPRTESQARPLTRLSPDQQKEAWQRAVETAPGGKVTAGHVQSVVDEMTGKPKAKPHTVPIYGKESPATRYAVRAISDVGDIRVDAPGTRDALDNLKKWWTHAKTDQRKAFSKWARSSEGVMSWTHSRPRQAEQIIDEAIIVIESIPHTDPKRRDALQKLRNWIDKHWR